MDIRSDKHPKHPPCTSSAFSGLIWWMMLLVAVLAIPSIALIFSAMVPAESEFMRAVVFILACWGCTWVGMWLMKKSAKEYPRSEQTLPKNE